MPHPSWPFVPVANERSAARRATGRGRRNEKGRAGCAEPAPSVSVRPARQAEVQSYGSVVVGTTGETPLARVPVLVSITIPV